MEVFTIDLDSLQILGHLVNSLDQAQRRFSTRLWKRPTTKATHMGGEGGNFLSQVKLIGVDCWKLGVNCLMVRCRTIPDSLRREPVLS